MKAFKRMNNDLITVTKIIGQRLFHNDQPRRAFLRNLALCLTLIGVAGHYSLAQASGTVDAINERGLVRCGVPQTMPGFAAIDTNDRLQGLNVDYCRAVAAATLGDANAVSLVPVSLADSAAALMVSDVDVLVHRNPWTLTQDAEVGEFVGVLFHDGQGFLSRRSDHFQSARELANRSVCVTRGSEAFATASQYFKQYRLSIMLKDYRSWDRTVAAYRAGKCTVLTADRALLAMTRSTLAQPDSHVLLPDILSKAPYGPMVRHSDTAWVDVTRWVLNCWITAEEQGIDRASVNRALKSRLPPVRHLLGRQGDAGGALGLPKNWCYNVIALVGHYGESYQRHVGTDSTLNLPRGINALWNNGGILYAPPVR